jgi:hypothetical protein
MIPEPQPRPNVSIVNVGNISAEDLVAFIYPMKTIPMSDNVEVIAPLLPHFANEYNLYSQLHARMMAIKAQNKSPETTVKIDVLYRALRCAEMNYNAVSRILTVVQSKNPAQKWSGIGE